MPIMALALAGTPQADDAGVNGIYARMSDAYRNCDVAALAKVYAEDAIVFPTRPNVPPLIGRAAIVGGPGRLLAGAKASGCGLSISFRVTGRQRHGFTVVDTGLYRLTSPQPQGSPRVDIGKFMVTAARQEDGSWAFASDTDTPMAAGSWTQARPVPGATFDD